MLVCKSKCLEKIAFKFSTFAAFFEMIRLAREFFRTHGRLEYRYQKRPEACRVNDRVNEMLVNQKGGAGNG